MLIAALHRDWGEAQGNYDELRFFTGLRPSEAIALVVTDFDVAHGVSSVTKPRVLGINKDVTKTRTERDSEPRSHRCVLSVTSSKPTTRYQDIRRNVAKIREYLARGGGLNRALTSDGYQIMGKTQSGAAKRELPKAAASLPIRFMYESPNRSIACRVESIQISDSAFC